MFRIEGHINTIKGWADAVAGAFSAIQDAIASFVAWLRSFVPGIPRGGPGGGMPGVPGFTPLPAPGTPGGAHRQSWVPPLRGGPTLVPVSNVLTIDGHKIGEAVSHYIAAAATHVQSAAQYDGGLGHVPVDLQFA